MTTPQKMIPDPDGRNAEFYRHVATGRLHLQQCTACQAWYHPPRYLCRDCGSSELAFAPVSGKGKVFSWTVTHRPVDAAWAAEIPYATVVVAMDEGPRLVGALSGMAPEDLALDLPVCASIEGVNEEFGRILFQPDSLQSNALQPECE